MPDSNVRSRKCAACGDVFSYEIGRGRDRRLCSELCRRNVRHEKAKSRPLCVTEGCRNGRQYKSGVCNSCYWRVRRTGSVQRRAAAYRSIGSNGYVRVSHSDHPLATPDGWVYEHRQVLYDAIGPGLHACHWCAAAVGWAKGACSRGALVVDHLDGDKANNQRANLVPACNRCNATRGLFMGWVREHREDPVLTAMFMSVTDKVVA